MILKKIAQRILKRRKKFIAPTKEFIFSEEYDDIMSMYLETPFENDLHEAQKQTPNFLYRHHDRNHELCIFRWRGIQKYKDIIVEMASRQGGTNIDLGGAACPLGFSTKVVDFLNKDAFGRKVPYKYIDQVPGKIDFLFSSHTLEHIVELKKTLQELSQKMNKNGLLIFHLPSFSCERWRVGTHSNKKYNDHCWTFGLTDDKINPDSYENYLEIDTLIGHYFKIEIAENCGDDSIYIQATPKVN